ILLAVSILATVITLVIVVAKTGLTAMLEQNAVEAVIGIIVGPLILLAVLLLMYYSKLITEVRGDGIYIRYVPFHRSYRRFLFSEIQSWEPRTYSPIGEYGGWGIRWGRGGGIDNLAYNVSGNQGVQLVLKNGKRILIGSQKPQELAQAIESAARRSG
ncbi:MAG: DUF6141 family protein, partial [Armatimonadetes bacterium]|nr:DUF6141 family protein [Armatimonadota bacterium]